VPPVSFGFDRPSLCSAVETSGLGLQGCEEEVLGT